MERTVAGSVTPAFERISLPAGLGMPGSRRPIKFELALLLVVLIWGINFPLVKYAIGFVAPLTFNACRFTVSVAFLGVLVLRERRKITTRKALPRYRWLGLLGMGLLGHFAYQVFFILGLDLTTSGICAFLISTSPIWTATVGAITGNDRLSSWAWLGLSLAFVGASTMIVGRSGFDLTDSTLIGNAVSFLAAIAWGIFTAMSRPFLDDHSPTALAFLTMLAALPFLWAITLPQPDAFSGMENPTVWLVVAYSGVLSTGVAYILWNEGIRNVGAAHTAVFANLVPVVAFIIGMLWLEESGTLYETVGAVSILAGLFIMRRSRGVDESIPRESLT